MSSDYKGPMRQGLYWQPSQSWNERYHAMLDKLKRMEALERDLADRVARLEVDFWAAPFNSPQERAIKGPLHDARVNLMAIRVQIDTQNRLIRMVEDGRREP